MSVHTQVKRTTVSRLHKMKREGEKIAALTAYDASFAAVVDEAGMDVVLVGDSLGMVIQGGETTLAVTVDDIVYHTRAVASRCRRALLMADMPFLSYATPESALQNAGRLLSEGGAHMVKLEGSAAQAETVRNLAVNGIPVCAHLGLKPQSIHKLGAYRVQGRDPQDARHMLDEALALEAAGADVLLLECVPAGLAQEICTQVGLPVIGIGAGGHCDGQILVLQDILGITPGRAPRFAKNFLSGHDSIQAAVADYIQAVKSGRFPDQTHEFQ